MEDPQTPRQIDLSREEDQILVPSNQTIENALTALLIVRSYEDHPSKSWRKRFKRKNAKKQRRMVVDRLPDAEGCVKLLADRLTEPWRNQAYDEEMYPRLVARAKKWLDEIGQELTNENS